MSDKGSAPTATRNNPSAKERVSRKRVRLSSQHFPGAGAGADGTAAGDATIPRGCAARVRRRSVYFASSPDSCAGSAASFDWGSAFTERAVNAFRACPKFEFSGVRHLCERLCYLRAYEVRSDLCDHGHGHA